MIIIERSKMKKNFIIIGLVIINILTVIGLVLMIGLKDQWKSEATNYSKFAAGSWAVSDFHKGKLKKLRLRIEDQPNMDINKNIEFESGVVVKDWVGYSYALPFLKRFDSPNIQVSRIVVNAYNLRMKKCWENPNLYKQQLVDEIKEWKENLIKASVK
jgi:hypothetical protein